VKRSLLDQLVTARCQKQPVVLVRGLSSGRQFIVTADAISGDTDGLDRELRDAARDALNLEGARVFESDGERYLLQSLGSAPRMVIIGAVHIAQALIPMALQAHYDVCLIDPRTAFANDERFPGIDIDNRWPHEAMADLELDVHTAVVALSHDPKIDEPALQAAMDSDAFYIGALGSKGNHAKRLERLAGRGYSNEQLDRIFGPIGLHLGGRAPAEIAVAILAQVIQERSKRLHSR
jgi:xanthine dehydrogenase accessory factor